MPYDLYSFIHTIEDHLISFRGLEFCVRRFIQCKANDNVSSLTNTNGCMVKMMRMPVSFFDDNEENDDADDNTGMANE